MRLNYLLDELGFSFQVLLRVMYLPILAEYCELLIESLQLDPMLVSHNLQVHIKFDLHVSYHGLKISSLFLKEDPICAFRH